MDGALFAFLLCRDFRVVILTCAWMCGNGACWFSFHMHAASLLGSETTSDAAGSLPNVRGFVLLFRALRLVMGRTLSLSMFPRGVVLEHWHRLPASTLHAMHRVCDGHVDMRVLRYFVHACIDRLRTALNSDSSGVGESKTSASVVIQAPPATMVPMESVDGGNADGSSLFVRLRGFIDMLATVCVTSVLQSPEAAMDIPFAWYDV